VRVLPCPRSILPESFHGRPYSPAKRSRCDRACKSSSVLLRMPAAKTRFRIWTRPGQR
jgi:hypothetical protein